MTLNCDNKGFIVNFGVVKKLLLIVIVILLSIPAFSQVRFGFKFGAGLTKSTGRPYYPYTENSLKPIWQPGYSAGLVLDVTISDIFFLQWDLLYAQTNTLYNPDPNIHDPNEPSPGKVDLKTSFNTIQMPIVVRFATYDKKVTSYFEAGFYGGYTIDGTYSITSDNSQDNQSGKYMFENYRRGDFGFVIGGGFGTALGKKSSWALNLRYLFSTFDTYKSPDKNNDSYVKSQNRILYLTLILFVI